MEKKILYLEIDEEITSIIDRLRKTQESEIHLVVPKEAALIQSIVNLKLLKKQADNLGKQIQIITHDKVGRNLAEQVGLHSASKVGEQIKVPAREAATEAEKDIRFKAEAPKSEGVGIPTDNGGKKEPIVDDTKEIVFKKGAVLSSEEKAAVKESQTKAKGEPKAEEKGSTKKRSSDFLPRFPHKKFALIAAILILILGIFLYIFVPMTNVKLKIAAEQQNLKTDFTVDKNTNSINQSADTIPGDFISANQTITKKYQATGKQDVGTKAQGSVTIANTYSTVPQTLVAGTRLTSNGLTYRTLSDVTVPGYTDNGNGPVAGTAPVSVTADSPGDQYNTSSGTFKIPGFAGTAEYDKMNGSVTSAINGGTSKQVTVVSSTDITNAQDSFANDAKGEITKDGQNKLKSNETLNDKAEKITVGSMSVSNNAGDQTDSFTISAPASFTGLAYNKDDLNQMAYNSMKSKAGSGKQVLEDKLDNTSVTINNVDLSGGTISGEVSANLHLGTKIDENQLKTSISGDGQQKAEDYLKGLDGVQSVELDFFPSFLHQVSRIKSHIYIKTDFVEQQ